MKYFYLLIFITARQESFAQIVFKGISVTDFGNNVEGWHKLRKGILAMPLIEKNETTGYFDEINKILEDDQAEISFTSK